MFLYQLLTILQAVNTIEYTRYGLEMVSVIFKSRLFAL